MFKIEYFVLFRVEYHLQGAGFAYGVWMRWATRHPYFLLVSTRSKRIQVITCGEGLATGIVGMLSVLTVNHYWDFILGFLSPFYLCIYHSLFTCLAITARHRSFKIRSTVFVSFGVQSSRNSWLWGASYPLSLDLWLI